MVADWESSQPVHGFMDSQNMTSLRVKISVSLRSLYWHTDLGGAVNPRTVSLKSQRRGLRRWFSWHNAYLVSMRTWVQVLSIYIEKVGVLVDVYTPGTVGWIGGRSRQILCCLSLLVCRLACWWVLVQQETLSQRVTKRDRHNGRHLPSISDLHTCVHTCACIHADPYTHYCIIHKKTERKHKT